MNQFELKKWILRQCKDRRITRNKIRTETGASEKQAALATLQLVKEGLLMKGPLTRDGYLYSIYPQDKTNKIDQMKEKAELSLRLRGTPWQGLEAVL